MVLDASNTARRVRRGIMTVRKLVHCGQIKLPKIKIIVAPLKIVRGVAATCRVVAVED